MRASSPSSDKVLAPTAYLTCRFVHDRRCQYAAGVVDGTLPSPTCSKGTGLVQFCRRHGPSEKLVLRSWDGQMPRCHEELGPFLESFARRLTTPLIAALGPRPRAKTSDDLANRLHLFCSLTGLKGWGPLFLSSTCSRNATFTLHHHPRPRPRLTLRAPLFPGQRHGTHSTAQHKNSALVGQASVCTVGEPR